MARKIPVSRIMDAIGNGREAAEKVGGAVRVDVRVDPLVPRWIAQAVRDDLDQRQSGGVVDVRRLGAHPLEEGEVDAAVILAGGSDRLVSDVVRSYVGRGVPVAVLAESSLDVPDLRLSEELDRLCTLVAASDRSALDAGLAEWLIGVTDKHVSMAANFPFCREAEAERLERHCAMENAAVGAVDLLHGADLPIMCGNQLKLYFDLAASRGKGLAPQRIAGVALVVGLAFWWRAFGRALVHHAPAGKFAVRAAMGYAGTVATSRVIGVVLDAEDGKLQLPKVDLDLRSLASRIPDALARGRRRTDEPSETKAPALAGKRGTDDGTGTSYLTYEAGGTVR